jgi:hypothetical protein
MMKVFFDANVLIQAGAPPGGPIVSRIRDLVRADLIEVITTDVTIAEIAKKHTDNEYEVIKDLGRPYFRRLVAEHLGVEIPEVSKAELKPAISKKYSKAVEEMLKSLNAKTLRVDDIKPSTVFATYVDGSGFFTGEGKRGQFPDAFIFERLRQEGTKDRPLVVVSNDNDFDASIKATENLTRVKNAIDLFKSLGLEVEAPEVQEFLDAHEEDLVDLVNDAVNEWTLIVTDVEDAEITESQVSSVDLLDATSFRSIEKGGNLLVIGSVSIKADVSYTHPNWDNAMWDSEDKRLIPFEDVDSEREVTFEAKFSMSISVDQEGSPSKIDEFRITRTVYVELYPVETYK